MKKICLLIITILLISCSSNRFHNQDVKELFTLNTYNPEYDKECRYKDFHGGYAPAYKNGVNTNRVCAHYNAYLCRINITCKDDEQCKKEAEQYWIIQDRKWKKGDDPVEIVGGYCQRQKQRCNNAPKGDYSCISGKKK